MPSTRIRFVNISGSAEVRDGKLVASSLDGWADTSTAARMLGVTPRRVRAMIQAGLLESRKMGRDHLVSLASIQEASKRDGLIHRRKDSEK